MNKLLISLLVTIGITGVAHAAGDAAAGKGKTAVCAACHGADGNSAIANFPKLAGQNEKYLIKQMDDIKSGKRPVVEMTGLLDAMSDQDIADIAAYFAKQNGTVGHAAKDLVEQGQKIYRAGIASKGVAACTACHAPTGEGNGQAGFPAIGGQHAAYTEKQLQAFRKGERNNDPQQMMQDIAAKLSDAEMKAVSSYIQGLSK
ncbi:c-type cytochrome [Neptuniibacter caesariensis]|uniref:Cytochrome c4 n=1 Tax=Neptuniibacter caesariensis TaxID=207954 RepID=A0A7U8C9Z9_NEPCE|nr:c-type cytochrome [Neptuniibacter caesariensis]EAR62494.1 cytochrome c4 [Oceanospirillum sp. MED92] [Neptuniibacter caesariensis]